MDGIILDDVKKVIGFVSDNMKWPPTAKQISDAGLTPSEHALARRF